MDSHEITSRDRELDTPRERQLSFNRDKVMDVQDYLASMPQVELPVMHHFSKIECEKADKIYLRQMFIPAGTGATGFEHIDEHLFILAAGRLTITTDDGDMTIDGPRAMNTRPGIKRVVYAHEDSVIMTIHATNLSEPDEIMASILKPEPGSPYRLAFGGGEL